MKVNKRVLPYRISDESTLLINTLTGAIDIITPEILHYLENINSTRNSPIDDLTRERLKRRGYIFESIEDETRWLQYIIDAYSKTEKSLSFVVCPTYGCNLRCTYCFEGDLTSDSQNCMSIADVEMMFRAIDKLSDAYKNRSRSIGLFGGEPLLPANKEIVRRVLEEAQKRAIPVGIVTNGVFVEHYTDVFNKHKELISSVQVTIDGPERVHDLRRKSSAGKGSFDKACEAIDMLLRMKINVRARTNIDTQNLGYLQELFDYIGAKRWRESPNFAANITPVEDHACKRSYEFFLPQHMLVEQVLKTLKVTPELRGLFQLNMFRTLRHINSVVSESDRTFPLLYYCEANNFEQAVFGPDGHIYACTEGMGNPEMAIGQFRPALKINEEAIKMWNGRNVLTIEKCKECDIAFLCGGGCAYSALVVNGDINEPVCNNARETIFAYLDYIKADLADKASA
jgi:uncharacterized protein